MGLRSKFKKFTRKFAQETNDVMGDDWANRHAKLAEDLGAGKRGWSPDAAVMGHNGLVEAQIGMRNEQEAQQASWDREQDARDAATAEQERRLRDRMFQGNRKVGRGRASLRIDR